MDGSPCLTWNRSTVDVLLESAAPRSSVRARPVVYTSERARPRVTPDRVDGGVIYRRRAWIQLATVAALLLLTLFSTAAPSSPVAPPAGRRITITRAERRGHYCRTRVLYDSNSDATYQNCRLLIRCGDVEVNPGPSRDSPTATRAQQQRVLTVSLQNARSLKSKLGELRAAGPELSRLDVVAVTETWFNDTVLDSELATALPDHTWFRRDRGLLGGGVACAVRSQLQPTRLPDPPGSELLLVRLGAVSVTLAVCYRPPDDDASLAGLTAAIDGLPGCDRLVLAGDINLPEVQWLSSEDSSARPVLQRRTDRACGFLDSCNLLGLKQWVSQPTRGPNILDLVLTRGLACTAVSREGWLTSDHHEVIASIVLPVTKPLLVTRTTVFNYKRADFASLRRTLSLAPWSMMDGLDVDGAADVFYSLLEGAIHDHVPRVTLRRMFPPWFDAAARAALRAKEAAFRRLRRSPSDNARRCFSEKRAEFKNISRNRYSMYLCDLVNHFRSNPKRYWTFLKCFSKKGTLHPVLRDGQVLVSDDVGRASLLNKVFAEKFSDHCVTAYPSASEYHLSALNHIDVSADQVNSILKSVRVTKACGPDGISARIVHECASELSVPLAKLCKMSLSQGAFPSRWKQANIVPLHKKGDKKDPKNYRSVSLLSLFGKVLEKIVYDELLRHVAPVLSSAQHGFLPGRSCITNLTTYLHTAWGSMSDGCQTDAIYTDFSAAFQSVNHKLLLFKLAESYGISGKIFDWFVSYLSDREQRVIVNGRTSEWAKVTSGVPEGAHLAPLLFSLFINDLPTVVASSKCVMYADDVKIYRQISSPADCQLLQSDLTNVCEWAARWRLVLNPQKCLAFTITLKRAPILHPYHINSSPLQRAEEVRDLGVIIDSKLTFSAHISSTVTKANRALGLLIRSFQTGLPRRKLDQKALIVAYCANVRPILEYGSVVWAGAAKTHLNRLERVQSKFLSWLSTRARGTDRSVSRDSSSLLTVFNMMSLEARRTQSDLVYLRNVFSGRIDCSYLLGCFGLHVPSRSTRNSRLFSMPYARVSTVKSGTFTRLPALANSVIDRNPDVDFFSDSFSTFKSSVIAHCTNI